MTQSPRDSNLSLKNPALRPAQAIELGDAAALASALSKGANPNAKARADRSLLSFACRLKQTDCALALIAAGACPDGSRADKDAGDEPLRLACSFNLPTVVLALLRAGASLKISAYEDSPLISEYPRFPQVVAALIEGGANVNDHDFIGNTPLISFCAPASSERAQSYLESIALLLQAGARPREINDEGATASQLAIAWGNPAAAALIDSFIIRDALRHSTPNAPPSPAKARL